MRFYRGGMSHAAWPSSSNSEWRAKALIFWLVKIKRFKTFFGLGSATMWSTSNNRSKFKVIVLNWAYHQKNCQGRFSHERISNYWSIMYWTVAREQFRKYGPFLIFSDPSVHHWPIVYPLWCLFKLKIAVKVRKRSHRILSQT